MILPEAVGLEDVMLVLELTSPVPGRWEVDTVLLECAMLVLEITSPVPERWKCPVPLGCAPFLPVPKAPVPDGATTCPVPDGMNLLVMVGFVVTLCFVLVSPLEIIGPVVTPVLTLVGVVVTTPALVEVDRIGGLDEIGTLVTALPTPVEVMLSVQVVSMLDTPTVSTAVTVDGRCVTVERWLLTTVAG